ncbi:trypsin-like serine peptidase [Puniceibacterium confluentis]|uniref:trypsin-like serine peptidase n=1 Tax=Puniceibacterium confluentis TaxID=1958944 RepID=UPI0011B7C59D|nr:trypsin-like peptidase domain-containing protein [Puniceibacterium confluentis]
MKLRGLLALAALFCAPLAAADSLKGLDGLDRRGELLGWEGVGRIDLPGGLCTGVLIAPDAVLTAAHCVHDRSVEDGILFRAGYAHGTSMADRRVSRIVLAPGYRGTSQGRIGGDMVRHDVALLRLAAPISSAEADPFRIFDGSAPGARVSVVSYGRGREEALSRQADCAITQVYRHGIMGFDCNVTFGSSGAPVFVRQDGRLRILSLISGGTAPGQAGGEAYGMSLPDVVQPLMAELRRDDARPKVTNGARRVIVGQRTSAGGAKFVRP